MSAAFGWSDSAGTSASSTAPLRTSKATATIPFTLTGSTTTIGLTTIQRKNVLGMELPTENPLLGLRLYRGLALCQPLKSPKPKESSPMRYERVP
ncbi:unnamed protein product [Phytophthora lilii]|uniref:Unnamed protein product n=1 Tax=Phytophthora lilii TaxID=2077276 RepID=A0A9W6XJY5_9STRA|nr:unnamed protein product [Phytophthora lilii]